MRLSARLLKLAGKVPDNAVIADIGTDHALLPIYLISTGRASRVIAVEVADGPYRQADRALRTFGMENAVELRKGDGLRALSPGEVDAAIIAGVGGRQMIAMLESDPAVRDSIPTLILQPMRGGEAVRRYLVEHRRCLADEELVLDQGEIYEIFVAKPGWETIEDPILYEVGPRIVERRDPLLQEWIARKIRHCRRILLQVEKGNDRRAQETWRELQEKIRRLGELSARLSRETEDGG